MDPGVPRHACQIASCRYSRNYRSLISRGPVQSGSSLVNFPRSSSVSQSVEIGAELISIGADVFRVSATAAGEPKLQISFAESRSSSVNNLAVFTVDDAQGRIDGLAPDAAGSLQAAFSRARDGLSTLTTAPEGFDPAATGRSLAFEGGEQIRFLLIQNDTLDTIRKTNPSDPAVLLGGSENLTITSTGRGGYSLAWNVGSGEDFKDVVFNIEASEAPLPLALGPMFKISRRPSCSICGAWIQPPAFGPASRSTGRLPSTTWSASTPSRISPARSSIRQDH